jgi:predicted amidophosphoribosyltransferase
LLIDDVATSGAHIEEAALLLKANHTPAILPLVWIAAS